MGTWEEESRELLESYNEISNDVDVEVGDEVVNVGGGDYRDHESNVVIEEGGLVQKFERLDFKNNKSYSSKIQEEKSECDEGTCKLEQNCRYNHTPKRGYQAVGDNEKGFVENNGSVGDAEKTACKFYQTSGCKYGDGYRYNHCKHSARETERENMELNCLGLPIRPSAQECTFYLRNGTCGYGANCRFHHPDPGALTEFESGNSLKNGKSVTGYTNVPRNHAGEPFHSLGGVPQDISESPGGTKTINDPPYGPGMRPDHHRMPPAPVCNQSQDTDYLPANRLPRLQQVMNNFSKKVDPSIHYENLMQLEEFPERSGQPDCDYFMKTGNCKYRSACRYNHPTSVSSKLRLPPLSSKGHYSRPATMLPAAGSSQHLNSTSNNMRRNGKSSTNHRNYQMEKGEFPERPNQPDCEYYMKTGQCKFMSACRYHHPRNGLPTSSLYALSEKGFPLRQGAKLC